MTIQFACIQAFLIYVLIFHDSTASYDTATSLAPEQDKIINDQNEVNCTELEVYLKMLIKEQNFLLQQIGLWMNDYNHHEYGFEPIFDAEQRISLIQHEITFQQASFENTINIAKLLYIQDQLQNDTNITDEFISSIENIQADFELVVQELFWTNKMLDEFMSLSKSYEQCLTLFMQLKADEIANLFEKHDCSRKIHQHQQQHLNVSYSTDYLKMYQQQSHAFQDNHKQIVDAVPAAIEAMRTLISTELMIEDIRYRMNQFIAIQEIHEISAYVAEILRNGTNTMRAHGNSTMEELD